MQLRRSLTAGALALALMLASATSMAFVTVGVSITIAPPALPIYEQPEIPGPGYLWVPGYWAWSDDGYYWVPGTWVMPPQVGFLWTPGYWGWVDGLYVWNAGYWGPRVGFYGGVDYGFGYTGEGYAGGYWDHDRFFYNRSVNRIDNVHITNVYNRTVVNNVSVNRVSYNGGAGGVHARPSAEQMAIARGPHIAAAPGQMQQERVASHNPQLRANFNHGRPPVAATLHPGAFQERGVVGAVAAPEGRHVPERSVTPRPHPEGMAPSAPSHPAESTPHNGFASRPSGFASHPSVGRAPESRPAPQYHGPGPSYAHAPPPAERQPPRGEQYHAAPSIAHAPPPAERQAPRGEPPRGEAPRGEPRGEAQHRNEPH